MSARQQLVRDYEVALQYIGPLNYPKLWGPVRVNVPDDTAHLSLDVEASHTASLYMRVQFTDWQLLDAGWASAHVCLTDVNGWVIGRRPALVYQRVYDVPTFTNFYVPKDEGVFSLSIRRAQ